MSLSLAPSPPPKRFQKWIVLFELANGAPEQEASGIPPAAVVTPTKIRRLLNRRTGPLPASTYSSAIPFPLSSERSPYLTRMVASGEMPVNGGIFPEATG